MIEEKKPRPIKKTNKTIPFLVDNERDRILLDRSYRGEIAAIDKLFKYYYGYAISYCISTGCDRNTSQEITQNTLLKIFEKIKEDKGRRIENFKAYLFKSLDHNNIDFRRKNSKHRFVHEINEDVLKVKEKNNHLKKFQAKDEVKHKLSQLTPIQKKIIEEQNRGYSIDEIAENNDLNSDQVRGKLYRARQKLKKLFKL